MTHIRLSCQTVEEDAMNTDPKKWNPFKFLRGAGRKSGADSPEGPPASEQWRAPFSDIPRFFSREPWRAVEEFFHGPNPSNR